MMGNLNWPWKDPNVEKRLTDIIDDVRKKLHEAQNKIEILERKESERSQEHVQENEERKPSDPEKGIFEKVDRFKVLLKSWQVDLDTLEGKTGDVNRQGNTSPGVSIAKNRKVAIQLYCAQETDMTDYALRELEAKLSSHQFHQGMKFAAHICEKLSDIQAGIPLIIICLNSSRLGVDLSNAISEVPTGSNTALLIFHHLKPHALPTQPSNIILKNDDVSNVGITIDVAFFEKMGLYDCDMNRNAYRKLITFFQDNYKM